MVTLSNEPTEKNLKLSIQVSLNGLSFCARSQKENKIVFFKDFNFEKQLNPIQVLQQIEKLYDRENFLQKADPEVIVLFSNELYSFVPEPLFSEENASDYLKYNTKILETDYVAHDLLDEEGIVNVYIPYTNINNFFFEKYGEFEYRHCISFLADQFLKLNRNDSETEAKVFVYCYTGGYDLLVIRNSELILANSFKCSTKEDFIYYLLFTAEQLDLDPNTFKLILLGNIKEDSDYYRMAYTYVKEIEFLKTSFGYIFALDDETPKGYMYYPLLKAVQ